MLFLKRTSKIVGDGGVNEKSFLFVVRSNLPGTPTNGRAIIRPHRILSTQTEFLVISQISYNRSSG